MRAMLRLGLCLCAMLSAANAAEKYPTRPVHIIVGLTAGSGVDIMARMVAQKLQDSMGQPFIVENRPGAGSNIATRYAASTEPPAPGRFSTMNGCPSPAVSRSAIWRAVTSTPPGANGTTIRTGFAG